MSAYRRRRYTTPQGGVSRRRTNWSGRRLFQADGTLGQEDSIRDGPGARARDGSRSGVLSRLEPRVAGAARTCYSGTMTAGSSAGYLHRNVRARSVAVPRAAAARPGEDQNSAAASGTDRSVGCTDGNCRRKLTSSAARGHGTSERASEAGMERGHAGYGRRFARLKPPDRVGAAEGPPRRRSASGRIGRSERCLAAAPGRDGRYSAFVVGRPGVTAREPAGRQARGGRAERLVALGEAEAGERRGGGRIGVEDGRRDGGHADLRDQAPAEADVVGEAERAKVGEQEVGAVDRAAGRARAPGATSARRSRRRRVVGAQAGVVAVARRRSAARRPAPPETAPRW